jgi:hypothetical protein
MICSSVNLDFLISPPFVTSNAEDSHLRWYSFRGAGQNRSASFSASFLVSGGKALAGRLEVYDDAEGVKGGRRPGAERRTLDARERAHILRMADDDHPGVGG